MTDVVEFGGSQTVVEFLDPTQAVQIIESTQVVEISTSSSIVGTINVGEGAGGLLPSGGEEGQVLTRTAENVAWASLADMTGWFENQLL